MTKVFISYSHDSEAHRQQVLELSDRLNKSGLDCDIDQYINGSPEEGWPLWMEKMLDGAVYVLVVCTETYLNRVQRKEKTGVGKGVKWESLLTYQDIYDNDSLNRKFIPVVFTADNAAFIPKPLKAVSHYDLSRDDTYEKLLRFLTGQPLAIKPKPGQTPHLPPTNATPKVTCVNSDELTIVKGRFFGRKAELALLDKAWAGNDTRIVQFTAAGGTGKTKLLRHWLDNTSDITCLVAWSFYAQGSTEDKQTSATPFFLYVLEALQSPHSLSYFDQQPEALGRHIAALVHAQRCVLVLDGLEPLQYADKGNRGELKDRALKALVKSLAGQNDGLCIITTRIPLYEISDRDEPLVIRYTLENLHVDDGVELLKSLKVRGKPDDLATAVRAYGCHALALNLLGALLSKRYQGDVNQHIQLKALVNPTGDRESRHAFKVMQTYAEVLADTPELKLLYLLGLFDHSIDLAVLRVLWQAQIPDLTATISEDDWLDAIDAIRNEWYLLTENSNTPNQLDCHPLIREYFGKQLKDNQPEVWQQAHERLYEYYKALPEKELPDTLEEMQPLFSAVVHGCAAKLYEQVRTDVYLPCIRRYGENYLCIKLGAFNDDLSLAANFFLAPWKEFCPDLDHRLIAEISNGAGFSLSTIGRLREALEITETALKYSLLLKDWETSSQNATNLSQFQLMIGNIKKSIILAEEAISHAKKSGEKQKVIISTSTLAHAHYQAGNIQKALYCLRKAEKIQKEHQPDNPKLYSFGCFVFCDVLLCIGQIDEAIERVQYGLLIAIEHNWLPDIALGFLSYAHCLLYKNKFHDSLNMINSSIDKLKYSQQQTHLPDALLVRAALYRKTHDFTCAHQDLQEVLEIVDYCKMRLHLTDYHLEMARLLVAESLAPCPPCGGRVGEGGNSREAADPAYHIAEAARLINETGYHRRDQELLDLQQALAKESCP